MTLYRLSVDGYIVRIADGAMIPPDPGNSDYQAFLAWSEFNTPDPLPAASLFVVAGEARYKAETSGIIVSGSAILTDRQSQALINGAVSFVQLNPTASVRFKVATGTFATLSAQQVLSLIHI